MKTVIDTSVTKLFHQVEVSPPPGFNSNFLGIITRNAYWDYPNPADGPVNPVSYSKVTWPAIDDNILDWVILLEAVVEAKDQFNMVALGAGWGRWLVAGAYAARQIHNIHSRLTGVEAEPTHYRWMLEHFRDNKLDPARHRLVNSAITGKCGEAWFTVGNPSKWYGQAVIKDTALDDLKASFGAELDYQAYTVRKIRTVDLEQMTYPYDRIDYIHMDVQGSELEVLSAFPEILQAKVKRIEVGTHSNDIEAGLRILFARLGWECQYDIPLNGEVTVDGKDLKLGDGCQVWINPRFVRRGR